MEDKNSELLFEYLRSILYDKKIQPLDVEQLDEPFRKLGRGLQYFAKTFTETKQYAAALSRGNLSVQPPPRENFLCENLKNIHANLNHLTWQAKQVAKGDYSQTVSYLGEFSEAFNTMTQQLKERELKLKQEAEREKIHAGMVETYNQLLVEMIDRSEEEIFVTSADGRRILYCKKRNDRSIDRNEVYQMCIRFAQKHRSEESRDSFEWIWEAEDSRNHFYRIITGYMQWQGEQAFLYIIRDVTKEKLREERLRMEANRDGLTQIGNRHYFLEKAEDMLKEGSNLTFCYCDLDHLKYINDQYGHTEGDWYITFFVEMIQKHIRKEDVFARIGGDEFCVILCNCPYEMAERKIRKIQKEFSSGQTKEYPKSFSCGIVEVEGGNEEMQVRDIIKQADHEMYLQKKEHKKKYRKELSVISISED